MDNHLKTNWTTHDDIAAQRAIRAGASRRDLLRMLTAGGIAFAGAGTIVRRAFAATDATPVHGGSLVAAGFSSSTADTLDPARASLSTDYVNCCSFYNRLTMLNETGHVELELAERFDTKDAQNWIVTLRKGVVFHDGHSLTSADVVYSLKRHLDPAVGSKVATLAKQMTQIIPVDKQTVKIVLAAPNADLPTILAMLQFMIVADGTKDFSKGNGTGPFICVQFMPGVRSVGERNKNYWKHGLPYLDRFEFISISDDSARANALLAGNVQIAGSLDPRALPLIKMEPGYSAVISNSGNYTDLIMRLDMPPGKNPDFVTGMKYLLDRDTIKESVLRGLGIIANDQPISPSDMYYNTNLKPKPYDPDRAKFHFKKAGMLGETIPVVASMAATSSVEMAMVLQQSAANIGMNLTIQREPSAGYWSQYWLTSPVVFGNINPRPTPDILFTQFYASKAPWNESRYHSAKFDSMLVEARGMLDQAKRKEIYDEMQVMIADQAGTAIPAWLSNIDGISDKVKGLRPNPLGGLMGYDFTQYVWLS